MHRLVVSRWSQSIRHPLVRTVNRNVGNVHRKRPEFATLAIKSHFSTENTNNDDNNHKKMTLRERITSLWNKYGYTFVFTYLGIYGMTLGGIYLALDFDILNAASFGMDAATATKKVCDYVEFATGYSKLPEYIRAHPQVGTFVLAWAMTKFTEPIRFAVAVGTVPTIARVLGVTVRKSPKHNIRDFW